MSVNRATKVLLALGLPLYLVVCVFRFGEDKNSDLMWSLQGEWRLVKVAGHRPDGKPWPETEIPADAKIKIVGNRIYFYQKHTWRRAPWRFRINADQQPPWFDLVSDYDIDRVLIKGIFKLENDMLYICTGEPERRPKSFEIDKERDMWVWLSVYKREQSIWK
ncbi:MAG: TIGR03067 domain-containing protein [Gemmatales bacterium]|nr:TIGR03067 domain-containing protein [Gemmatales bacterium]MDW7993216.1 TIGR03067 domain-containing protein [Gemmatales bacterium]